MNRVDSKLKKRSDFIKLANENPKKASEILKFQAMALESCKVTNDIVFALSEIFFLHESTVYRDLHK